MSTTGKEYKLAIRIAGIIDKSFSTSLATANTTLKRTVASIDKDFTTLDKGFDGVMKVGKKCFTTLTTAAGVTAAAIAALTGAAISVGSEFESAFAGVKKTVEATEEEYATLRQDILDMTKEIPAAATEIAGVMEIAGQLGVPTESLTDFTETMINLGVSTNLAAEDAATALAKFSNIMTMEDYGEDGISNYERLGSTIVDLGNNFATTEADIVDMATNIAAAGKLAGLTESDIIGISTAMSSVGIASELGGSSVSRLLMEMQEAVASGGDVLNQYAETAGMTGDQFAKTFRDDASEALISFMNGLSESGENSYGILEDLGLNTIRLRKSFLSLAGADGLLEKAIDMANDAWDENTALMIESEKRYETAESQVQLLKNTFSELGIVAYEDLRDPFLDAVNTVKDKVVDLTEYVGGPDGVSEWVENIGTAIPTLQRKVKKYGGEILDFFNPLVDVGKWLLKNPDVIVSTLVGIGSAMTAYKIASNTTHLVNALMGLSTTTGVILGVVGAIGLLVGAYATYKQHEKKLINTNLQEHFGNIALSMEDIQRAAEYIVTNNSLGKVKESLEAFDDLDTISSSMEDAIEDINKMNWKVSIGMELTEDEQDAYKTAIADYISSAQEYASQSQYAVSISLSTAFDEKDLESNNVVDKVNQFYADKYTELADLGTQLNDTVTEAFNDGLLDIDEISVIAELQSQMAEIEQSLATGEFEAQLSILGMDYTNLDAETFQNLQAELDEQVSKAADAYKQAYAKNYSAITAAYDAGEYLSDLEYQNALDALQQEYMQNVAELETKAMSFQLDMITSQYSDEIKTYVQEVQDGIKESVEGMGDLWATDSAGAWSLLVNDIANSGLSKDTKGAISQLLEALEPSVEEMEALKATYEELGQDIPEAITEGLSTYNLLNALANGDETSAATVLGEQIFNSEYFDSFFQDLIATFEGSDAWLPQAVVEGVSNASADLAASEITAAAEGAVPTAIEGIYAYTQDYLKEYFSKPFTAEADVTIQLNPIYRMTNASVNSMNLGVGSILGINQRAEGGLATRPELTWFAENGPEMAIPIDGSQNAISLWEKTGKLLGMDSALDGLSLDGGTSPTISYSPTLQFYGEAPSRRDLEDAMRVSQDEFDSLMEKYLKTHSRVSFG